MNRAAEFPIRRLGRAIGAFFADLSYAQRRLIELRTAPVVIGRQSAPDDFAEFLFWTSGVLAHEPSARDRTAAKCR